MMNLQVEKIVYSGDGLAHTDAGLPVFVPFTLPGEVVQLRESLNQVEAFDLVDTSPDRITPRCVHFGACGGCQYQHMNSDTAVGLKAAILDETLTMAGVLDLPAIQLHAGEPWHYRNRIRLRIGVVDGQLRAGYNRRGSYDMLPIVECPIASPLLMQAANALLAVATNDPAWVKQLTGVELFCNGDESRVQMTLSLRSERGVSLKPFCDQVKSLLPALAGAGVVVVGESGRKEQAGSRWGADGLIYRVENRDYWVSRSSFFQVNRFLVEELLGLVTEGREGRLAWDLYAGAGLFSRGLADSFSEVVGVETVIGDLTVTLKGKGMRAVGMTTVEFLRQAVLQRERPDLIVMDPPRAGLGAEVCSLLIRINAPQMVYVSCDPQTLARDLKTMVDSGYTIHALHLVDMFPQTFHLETVVLLTR
jgi:23S rRNA (uracil1939-C5)-methyltransferase